MTPRHWQDREILEYFRLEEGRPRQERDLLRHFRANGRARRDLLRRLEELVTEGALVRLRGDRYALPRPSDLVAGRISLHRDGFGFVTPDSGTGGDLFIPARFLGGAMDGDRVQVAVARGSRGESREGRVVKILERSVVELIGIFRAGRDQGVLVPFGKEAGQRFEVPPGSSCGAEAGQVAVGRIESYPLPDLPGRVRIVRVLGAADDPEVEIRTQAYRFGLPDEFSAAALQQAEAIPREVGREDLVGRTDLRDHPFVTIDGETAKDFDDAVALVEEGGRCRLWVAIADVAWYVKAGSALDRDALSRGTSVYFPGTCLPMLPERLSNGICSLNPGVDRLVLVAEMAFDREGTRLQESFYPAVINSRERLTYTRVQEFLDRGIPWPARDPAVFPQLQAMAELTRSLNRRRQARGSLDFELPEAQILLDEDGRPVEIRKAPRLFAHRLIEEFMLAANEAVAAFLEGRHSALLYRVHEPPAREKLEDFQQFVAHFNHGLKLEAEGVRPQELQRLLAEVHGLPEEKVINQVLLRSMKQASYSTENSGHFGLATECYCHFTSPIRRYPDLVVHRALRRCLQKKPLSSADLSAELGEDLSWKERRAMEAERDLAALKKCQFMAGRIGEGFDGVVSGVQPFGLFVELQGVFIEGLVHVSALHDDYYHFEEDLQRLVGYNRRRIFQVGTPVRVRLARVDLDNREIDFDLGEPEPRSRQRRTRRGR